MVLHRALRLVGVLNFGVVSEMSDSTYQVHAGGVDILQQDDWQLSTVKIIGLFKDCSRMRVSFGKIGRAHV